MTRAEAALAECDRLIALWETAPGSLMPPLLRIGRDVLTRHNDRCDWCGRHRRHPELAPCPDVRPWLDLLAPEADV